MRMCYVGKLEVLKAVELLRIASVLFVGAGVECCNRCLRSVRDSNAVIGMCDCRLRGSALQRFPELWFFFFCQSARIFCWVSLLRRVFWVGVNGSVDFLENPSLFHCI